MYTGIQNCFKNTMIPIKYIQSVPEHFWDLAIYIYIYIAFELHHSWT